MNLESGKIIDDHRKENRWKIIGVIQRGKHYAVYQVEDMHPAMKRTLYLMCLEYGELPRKNPSFEINDLRHSFHQMAEILCMNYTFLPEPVDLIRFTNTADQMDEDLRGNEPALIFSQPEGFPLPKQTRIDSDQTWHKVKRTIRSCCKTLFALHQNKAVIRALPQHTIMLSHTTFKPYFFGFDTLIPMNEFKGYNPGKVCLEPEAVYTAPECYAPRGYLSPATDVYALGKLVMQIILPQKKFKAFFPEKDPFPDDIQNKINSLNLPQIWERFLSLCLNPSPGHRFQNTYEIDQFFSGKPSKPSTPPPKPGPWSYKPNPHLPEAALVIWSPWLTKKDTQFEYRLLYKEFQYQFSFAPRLFFQYSKTPVDKSLPFFKMIEHTYRLELILLTSPKPPEQARMLIDRLTRIDISNLILVGDGRQQAIQELFRLPKARDWNIIWVRAGEGQAPIPVSNLLDASLFIRKRKKKLK